MRKVNEDLWDGLFELHLFFVHFLCCVIPVATLVHVMKGFGSPWASQASLAVLSAGTDRVLMCGSAIFGLARTGGVCRKVQEL